MLVYERTTMRLGQSCQSSESRHIHLGLEDHKHCKPHGQSVKPHNYTACTYHELDRVELVSRSLDIYQSLPGSERTVARLR